MSAPSPRAREPSEFCPCRAVSCSSERVPPLDSGPNASPVRIPAAVTERYSEGWRAEQQRIRDAANAKRSDAAKDRPRNGDGTMAPSASTSCGRSGSAPRGQGSAAKAAASKTNRGSVERMDRLDAKRKEIWEAKNQVAQVEPPEIGYKKPPTQIKGFAESTAAATGKSKASINRAIHRAEAVCREARDLIRGTKLDTKRPEPHGQDSVDAAVSILLGARRASHTRRAAEKALASLSLVEKPMLLLYAFEERSDAERVLQFAGLCGVRAPVAKFSLVKLMYPGLFNAGAFSEDRPKGRRAVIDAEVRRADQLLGGWLRMGSAAFRLAYALNPPTSGEIQNPT